MSVSQANSSRADLSSPLSLQVGFAEPEWRGDADFSDRLDAADLDGLIVDLAARIDDGARGGWLDAYYARRAAFDLQSIRCQIDRERRRPSTDLGGTEHRAILSRIDRLSRVLAAAH